MNTISNILSTIFMNENTIHNVSDSDTVNDGLFDSRLKLSAVLLAKSHVILTNYSSKDTYNILKMILTRISLLSSIKDYSKDILVSDGLSDICNKLFIDSPGIYFTGSIKTNASNASMYILNNTDESKNICINIYYDFDKRVIDDYNSKSNTILIHKRDSLLIQQNKFFYNIVKLLVKCKHKEYMRLINSQDNDIEYIVIKNNKLLYI